MRWTLSATVRRLRTRQDPPISSCPPIHEEEDLNFTSERKRERRETKRERERVGH
jgi:hypothetical protein